MSRDAMKRAFLAGWGRSDTSLEFDVEHATVEFNNWYGEQLDAMMPLKKSLDRVADEMLDGSGFKHTGVHLMKGKRK